ELQITDGLIRQETGRLFPYNPEFYDNATGLYGPGAIYCWYMLLASVFASWFYCRPDHDGFMKPGISSDLLGALAYPVFAATDLLVQSIRMLGMDHRAEVIYCLRYPTADQLDSSGSPNTTQIDLNHIPADVLELGQHVVDIIGPLTVCCTATSFLLLIIIAFVINCPFMTEWKPKPLACWIIFAAYGYILLMLIIFHLSLGSIWHSLFLVIEEILLPFMFGITFLFTAFWFMILITSTVRLSHAVAERNRGEVYMALVGIGTSLLAAPVLAVPFMLIVHWEGFSTIPDLGIRVTERDQLATLIVGIFTLAYTIFDIWQNFYRQKDKVQVAEEEMQMLPSAEA
ncbi:hypothetical protein DER44DRAFT_646948, partial [Fusarium oxysporum]